MSTIADEILEAKGLDFDDLTAAEKDQYFKWLQEEEKSQVTFETIKEHISAMKASVELELVQTDPYNQVLFWKIPNQKHAHLKARLHNYLLIEALLHRPEIAKKLLESYKKPNPTAV